MKNIRSGQDLLNYYEKKAKSKGKVIDEAYLARQINPMSDSIWYVIEEPERRRFPGMLLPNGLTAPALLDEYRNKRPACIDRELNLHPATWNEQERKLICNLSQVDMLVTEQSSKTQMASSQVAQVDNEGNPVISDGSPINASDAGFSMVDGEYVLDKKKKSQVVVQTGNSQVGGAGSVTARMANQGGLTQPSSTNEPDKTPLAKSQSRRQSSSQSANNNGHHAARSATKPKASNPYIYNPIRSAQKSETQFYVHDAHEGRKYGIPIGTWIKAELETSANSGDSGYAELILLQSVSGSKRTLKRGTKLFARKTLNWGTERMDLSISKVLTPELDEFGISAKVYDLGKREGLNGILKRRRKEEIKALGSKAALKTLGQTIPQGETLVGDALTGLGDDMVDQEEDYLSQVPRGTIEVSPQIVWVKIERSF